MARGILLMRTENGPIHTEFVTCYNASVIYNGSVPISGFLIG